jgi:hypothetical protein
VAYGPAATKRRLRCSNTGPNLVKVCGWNMDRIAGYSVRRTTRFSPVFAGEFRHNLFEQATTNSLELLTYTLFITILSSLCQFKDFSKFRHYVSPDDSLKICDRNRGCLDLRLLSRHLPYLEVLGKTTKYLSPSSRGSG